MGLLLSSLLALTLALVSRAEAYVYWATTDPMAPGSGTIGRANLDGSNVDERFITGVGVPAGVAVNSTHIYWMSNETGAIGRARLDGTGATPNFIADARAPAQPGGLAVDEEHIYWVSRSNTSEFDAGIGAIGRANVDGTDADQNFITGLDYPNGPVAVAGSHLYWTIAWISEALYDTTDGIARANTDGTDVEESFLSSGGVMGVAVDDAHIWQTVWQRIGGEIVRTSLDGTGRETILGGGIEGFDCCPGPHIAVSDTHVYWAGGQTIARAKQNGRRAKHRFIALDLPLEHYVAGLAVDGLPFTFGELKPNRRHGTAKLVVKIPGPGKLALARTKKIKGAKKRAEAEGSVKLSVRPRGKAKRRLNKTGHVKVKTKVRYTPEGGEPNTQSKTIKLIKR